MVEKYNTRQTLIARIRNQYDDGSWEDFVYFYRVYIHTVVNRMGVADCDVEDIVQNVLLTLWQKLPDFEYQPARCKFRSWMNNVTRKKVLDYFRKRGRYQTKVEKAGKMGELGVELPDIYAIAEDEWKIHVSNIAWNNIKDDFDGKAIECFQLFREGKTVDQVCESLQLKSNSAYVLRKRVIDKLCREIRRLDEELS